MKNVWEAMADETRREILALLKCRPYTAGEICDQFPLSASTVSHHLSVLRSSGLIHESRRAQTRLYSLDEGTLYRLLQEVGEFLK